MKRTYFDISATTPMDIRVANFMHELQQTIYGNPSSIHREGQAARAIIEKSRNQISNIIKCKPDEIIFTSSGTESNNMVLKGILKKGDHFITSSYEHPAILNVIPFLKEQGVEVSFINPNQNGIIQAKDVNKEIRENTKLISIMYVNNELGTINPISEISTFAVKHKILFHSDAVQALGKIPLNTNNLNIDFLSFSAHKLYGPKGSGALYIKKGNKLNPLINGGNQEQNLRASTENITGIGGFGMAAELAGINIDENTTYIKHLEKYFITKLNEKEIKFNINGSNRVPGVFNINFSNIDGQTLVMRLDLEGIAISFGAACSSGTVKASKMLLNMGLSNKEALGSVRISFGKIHTKENIDHIVESIYKLINKQNKEFIYE